MLNKAELFAKAAHDSIQHKRKYTQDPYWIHPQRVASIVAMMTEDTEVIAAAWLHDVLEDVAPNNKVFNEKAIEHEFGDRVLQLVLEVTDISKPSDGNRATRKLIDRNHLAQASNEGKLIKLADMIDNVIDISKHDPDFAIVFKKEVALDLPYLASGDELLYRRLKYLLEK